MPAIYEFLKDLKITKEREVKAKSFLFHQGDNAKYIYAVKSGKIRMIRNTIEGQAVTIHVAYDGDTFAEAAMFSDVYHCSAQSVLDSKILCFPKLELLDIISQNPEKAKGYIAVLSRQIYQLRSRLELRNIRSARERLYQYFLLSADSECEIYLDTSLKEIAAELGLSHETFYRTMKILEEDGIINRENKLIRILS